MYATQAHLVTAFSEQELIQLTDRERSGSADDAAIKEALEYADELIDSKIAVRYSLPLAAAPKLLTKIACDLARWWLYDDAVPETVQTRYDRALKWLDDIAAGRATLGLDAADEPPPRSAARVGTVRSAFDWGAYG